MTPFEYSMRLFEGQNKRIKELEVSLNSISKSYLNLRNFIPGAFDTPTAPTTEQVYNITEKALEKFIKEHING